MGTKRIAWIVCWVFIASQAIAQTTIPAPGYQPSGLAFDGTFLYVAELSGPRNIFKVDPSTGDVINYFPSPSASGFLGGGNPKGLAYYGQTNRFFVVDIAGMVYEIDTDGTTIFHSFSLPFRGGSIAFDGTNLYIGNFDGGEILVTDRSGNQIKTIHSPYRPTGMCYDVLTGHLWLISVFDNQITEITTDGEFVRSGDSPRNPGNQGLGGITWVHSKLYIAEVSDPDPFTPPNIPGTIFIIDRNALFGGTPNQTPVAVAGENQTVFVGDVVTLDGSNSNDPDEDPLTHFWTIVTRPENSTTQLSDASTENPTFTPDISGNYIIQLIVNDGTDDSAPAQVTITAQTSQEATEDLIQTIDNWIVEGTLDVGQANALSSKLEAAIQSADQGNTNTAVNKLQAFANHVEAQRGKKLTQEQADVLLASVQAIASHLEPDATLSVANEKGGKARGKPAFSVANYPNPFNPETVIRYTLPEGADVRLAIYNILGQQVRELVNTAQVSGQYNVRWDGKDALGRPVSSGVYFYHLVARQNMATKKMVLVK